VFSAARFCLHFFGSWFTPDQKALDRNAGDDDHARKVWLKGKLSSRPQAYSGFFLTSEIKACYGG
jgi:hypothetical protein